MAGTLALNYLRRNSKWLLRVGSPRRNAYASMSSPLSSPHIENTASLKHGPAKERRSRSASLYAAPVHEARGDSAGELGDDDDAALEDSNQLLS